MRQIDWSGAPEGATHWVGLEGYNVLSPWEKHVDGERYVWKEYLGRWDRASMSGLVNYNLIVKRPTPWQGPQDGLPPVGAECEVSNCGQDFAWCLIKYMGSHLCVVDHKTHRDQYYHLGSVKFRPIQSDRAKVIDAAMALSEAGLTDTKWLNRLYDAGMLVDPERKPMSRTDASNILHDMVVDAVQKKGGDLFECLDTNKALDALGYKE